MSWPPLPDDPDTAAESHTVIDSFPAHKRLAAAMLLDLPPGHQVSLLCDPLDTDVVVGELTAAALLVDLWDDVASPEQVIRILTRQRLIRPGIADPSHPTAREDQTAMTTQAVTYHAVVGANTHHPDEPCDNDECQAPAEFEVGTADNSGALVADVFAYACAEHLAAQVRRACES